MKKHFFNFYILIRKHFSQIISHHNKAQYCDHMVINTFTHKNITLDLTLIISLAMAVTFLMGSMFWLITNIIFFNNQKYIILEREFC